MPNSEYHFIIVGGGTAGLVLAARLTEDPGTRVLVIEAGSDESADPRVTTPALWPRMVGTDCDWKTKTVEQTELYNRSIVIPQGRLLGGSSAINGLAFIANSQSSIDAWAELGNPGWEWSVMREYFKKTYTLKKPSEAAFKHLGLQYIDENTRGKDGPISLSFPEDASAWPKIWLETLTTLGLAMSADPFSGQACGGYVNAETVNPVNGQRSFAVNAYLDPIRARSNLRVMTDTLVERIILEPSTNGNDKTIAKGVQVKSNGAELKLWAAKEVMLSAGSFNSPKLLELSGIGDAKLLSKHCIDIHVDNPGVGENFQNHLMSGISVEVTEMETLDHLARQEPAALEAAKEAYSKHHSGPFSNSGAYASAVLPVFGFLGSEGKPELDKILGSLSAPPANSFEGLHQKYVHSVLASPTEASGTFISRPGYGGFNPDGSFSKPAGGSEKYLNVSVLLSYPLSRGSVHISSSDPSASPLIDPRYLTHPLDIEVLARHVSFLETIFQTEPLRRFVRPGGKRKEGTPFDLRDLDATKNWIRRNAVGAHHPTGTCSMIPREIGGVVDARLKVYGVENLRVCDASIIPITSRSNPQATVYAVAERAADLIKEDWGLFGRPSNRQAL